MEKLTYTDMLSINRECQLAIIMVASECGWNDSLEDDLLRLGEQELLLINHK